MSEEIEWLAVGSWSALAAFQIGAAIYDGWKAWSRWRRQQTTDFDRVINGETRNGWRRALPTIGWKDTKVQVLRYPVVSRLADHIEDQGEPTTPAGSSVTMRFFHPLPNGHKVFTLRRYSLIRAADQELLKVVFDPLQWKPATWSSFLTSRTVAVGFRRLNSSNIRLLLLDAFHRRIRNVTIEMPIANATAAYFFLTTTPKPQLHVILLRYETTQAGWRAEVVDAKYDLWSDGGNGQAIRALSWESISLPIGNRRGWCAFYKGSVVAFVNYDEGNVHDVDSHVCISFDHKRIWRVESLTHWLETFRNTKTGERVLEAIRSYAALSPPTNWPTNRIPPLKWYNRVVPSFVDGYTFGRMGKDGMLHRWLFPPSLKRLAAEALFKTNPNLKMSAVKDAIGFDISDGIVEETTDDVETIYL